MIKPEIPPVIAITSPNSLVYSINSVLFTYSILYHYTATGSTTIYVDNVANTTALPSGSLLSGLPDGVHNLTIVVINAAGDTVSEEILFTIDTSSSSSNSSPPSMSSTGSNLEFTTASPGFTVTTLLIIGIVFIPLLTHKRRNK